MRGVDAVVPGADRRPADFRPAGADIAAARRPARALIVEAASRTRVVGIIHRLVDMAAQIGAIINDLDVADLAVQRPGHVPVIVLIVDRLGERRFLKRPQGLAVGADRILSIHALGIQLLIALLDQEVPVVIDIQEAGNPLALVGGRVLPSPRSRNYSLRIRSADRPCHMKPARNRSVSA